MKVRERERERKKECVLIIKTGIKASEILVIAGENGHKVMCRLAKLVKNIFAMYIFLFCRSLPMKEESHICQPQNSNDKIVPVMHTPYSICWQVRRWGMRYTNCLSLCSKWQTCGKCMRIYQNNGRLRAFFLLPFRRRRRRRRYTCVWWGNLLCMESNRIGSNACVYIWCSLSGTSAKALPLDFHSFIHHEVFRFFHSRHTIQYKTAVVRIPHTCFFLFSIRFQF